MTNLTNIFPCDYPNPPSMQDLDFEVQELLCHSESPMDIIHYLNRIQCPYYRKALAAMVSPNWHQMERNGKEPAVYYDFDGQWRRTWMNVDEDMRAIIKQANCEQAEREIAQQEKTRTENKPQNTHPEQTNTTMPLIVQKHEGTINNTEYNNCTFIYGAAPQTYPQPAKETIVADIVPVAEAAAPHSKDVAIERKVDVEAFKSLLTIPYRNRKEDCQHMLELLTQVGYSKKDRARMALALYQSGHVALKREHITTFKQWYTTCCELLGWDNGGTCYKESQLTPNAVSKQIALYL